MSSADSRPLSSTDAQQLTAQVAELTLSGVPLAAGLRAAADEALSRRVASSLRDLAASIERGASLPEALQLLGNQMPEHVRELIAAASRVGRLAPVLSEFVEHQHRTQEMLRTIRRAAAYPLVTLLLSLLVSFTLPMLLGPTFGKMFREFDIRISNSTRLVIWLGDGGAWYLLLGVTLFLASFIAGRIIAGRTLTRTILARVPLSGPIWYWSSAAQLFRLLAVLIESQVPLPMALRVAATGAENLELTASAQQLARAIEQGQSLGNLLRGTAVWPMTVVPFVEWGERTAALPDAFRTAAEMLEGRAVSRAGWVRDMLPPFLFVLVAAVAVGVLAGLSLPLVELVSKLSG